MSERIAGGRSTFVRAALTTPLCQGYPDDMTDTADTARETPVRLSPRDEARLELASKLDLLVQRADQGIPVRPAAAPGDLLGHALNLQHRVNSIVESAVIAERERGTTWDQIGEAVGITRQSAHERWQSTMNIWAITGRVSLPSDSHQSSLDHAADIDRTYMTRHPDEPNAVTSGLDATRFSGSREYEHSLRIPAAALHVTLRGLSARALGLDEEYDRLKAEEADKATLAENQDRSAQVSEERVRIYEQLVTLEPALAEEHSAQVSRFSKNAKTSRSFAALLRE